MNEKTLMDAVASSFSRTDSGILGNNKLVKVTWVDNGAIGYTQDKPLTIHLAWDHPMYSSLTDDEKMIVRFGVNGHELLHQLLTNFKYTNTVLKKYPEYERAILMNFLNLLEDAAIEYFAPTQFGGTMLNALNWTIRKLYELSDEIGKEKYAYEQLISALIQFGDMGIVKGSFTFPEAEDLFRKVAPLFNEGVTCPDSKKRIDIGEQIFLMTKPLWEEIVKIREIMEKLIEEMTEQMQRNNKASEKDAEDSAKSGKKNCKSGVSKNRDKTAKKAEKGEDMTTGTSGEKAEEADSEAKDESEGETDGDGTETGSESEKEGGKSRPSSETKKSKKNNSKTDRVKESGGIGTEEPEDVGELTKDIMSQVNGEIKNAQKMDDAEIVDFRPEALAYDAKSLRVFNDKVSGSSYQCHTAYDAVIRKSEWVIKKLVKELEKIFEPEHEAAFRATSGSYNIMRGSVGTSARIFDKRRAPNKQKDVAVCLCVDNSGSMSGMNKIHIAKIASIILTEAFTRMNIPLAVMGFTADCCNKDGEGMDVVHRHFLTFKDKENRYSLAKMTAEHNNFDGFSVRYATEMLKARTEDEKVLFIISDGMPACRMYRRSVGESDLAAAVKEAKKSVSVFGIGIGRCAPERLQGFYGKDFIHCPDPADLPNLLSKEITKVLKNCLK